MTECIWSTLLDNVQVQIAKHTFGIGACGRGDQVARRALDRAARAPSPGFAYSPRSRSRTASTWRPPTRPGPHPYSCKSAPPRADRPRTRAQSCQTGAAMRSMVRMCCTAKLAHDNSRFRVTSRHADGLAWTVKVTL